MYCTFNPSLFNEFISMGKKIKPKFSDDWEIIFESFNYNDDVRLYSKKLGVTIAGAKIFSVFHMLTHYKVDLKEGKYIQGEFIIGKDRKLYSKSDYEKWLQKYKSISEGKVYAKDLKIGKLYQFKCGVKLYLIAIDRNEKNKPLYVFGSIEKPEYSEGKVINFQVENNLKNISKELETVIDEKIRKIIISGYLLKEVWKQNNKLFNLKEKISVTDKNGNILDKDYFSDEDFWNFECFYYDEYTLGKLKKILLKYVIRNYDVSYKEYHNEVRNIRIENNKIIFDYGYYNFYKDEFVATKKDIVFEDELFVYQIKKENLPKNIKV